MIKATIKHLFHCLFPPDPLKEAMDAIDCKFRAVREATGREKRSNASKLGYARKSERERVKRDGITERLRNGT